MNQNADCCGKLLFGQLSLNYCGSSLKNTLVVIYEIPDPPRDGGTKYHCIHFVSVYRHNRSRYAIKIVPNKDNPQKMV